MLIIYIHFLIFVQEELDKKLKENIESQKKVHRELNQMKVENQWLVNNKRISSGTEEKVEDMARDLQGLKRELKEEKEKVNNFALCRKKYMDQFIQVKNLLDWKTQLAEKNKELKDENSR